MQRRELDRRQNPRRDAERDGAQPMGGQPHADDVDDELQEPENAPSFLTAQELQARDPKEQDAEKPVGERRVLKERRRNPG